MGSGRQQHRRAWHSGPSVPEFARVQLVPVPPGQLAGVETCARALSELLRGGDQLLPKRHS
eukprot:5876250-Alexandrium_andersonii.AAC.1